MRQTHVFEMTFEATQRNLRCRSRDEHDMRRDVAAACGGRYYSTVGPAGGGRTQPLVGTLLCKGDQTLQHERNHETQNRQIKLQQSPSH